MLQEDLPFPGFFCFQQKDLESFLRFVQAVLQLDCGHLLAVSSSNAGILIGFSKPDLDLEEPTCSLGRGKVTALKEPASCTVRPTKKFLKLTMEL
jgi:hypothetical protein